MPVSVSSSQLIYGVLKDAGVRIVSALPETWLVHLIRMAEDDPGDDRSCGSRERKKKRVGISRRCAPGRNEVRDAHAEPRLSRERERDRSSCAQLYRIPLLMLISARGTFGERDPWQTEGGGVTEHVLEALRIPFDHLDSPDQVARKVAKAQTLAYSASRPVALLLTRDLMWEEA